ncbi:free fatty acid receptor 4-like [Amia ocellicauda]|uniref:free fatty acid receptor 4-like n=1 Tax=Amia ocellicauda TaxID=2972642 RepID=UPI0034645BD1
MLQFQNVSYFSFLSEFKHADKGLVTALETLVLLVVFVVSSVGNICAIALVSRDRQLVNKNVFVLNLFIADLLFVSTIPLIIIVRWTESWMLGTPACHVLFYIMCISGCVTIITLATISLERMIAILKLRLAPSFNVKLVSCALVFIWTFSAITSLPLCLFFQVMTVTAHGQKMQICTLRWPHVAGEIVWDIAFVGLDFLLPGVIIVISYSKILQITKSSRQRLMNRRHNSRAENHQCPVSKQDFKLFRTLFLLMVSFFLMWSPIFVATFLILIRNFQGHLHISSTMFFWVIAFTFANSALNPILYSIHQFRHHWRRSLCRLTKVLPFNGDRPATSSQKVAQARQTHISVIGLDD